MSAKKREQRSDSRDFEPQYIQQPVRTVLGEVFIKRYKKMKQVGAGSYSKCYLVKNTDSESTYVVKIIPKKKLEILQKQKLFYEIKIHKSLSHPNVVHLDHWFQDETYQYIFMEYCSRGVQKNLLKRGGKMQECQIRKYVYQIVESIKYIHEQKILHRDLKLCNFYLDDDWNVKLGDFGFACQLANDHERKRQTCGTPNYIAPEVISGFGYSFYSDVWSIGVIIFRLKYGYCPFEGEEVRQTLENVRLCRYSWPKSPKPSRQMEDLVEKIFTLNYDDRLSPEQILNHPFFNDNIDPKPQKKEGFSFSNFISRSQSKDKKSLKKKSEEEDGPRRKSILERSDSSRKDSMKNQEQNDQKKPKKYNSCDAFKQIKQIFKSKSKKSLYTNTNQTNSTYLGASCYHSANTNTSVATSQNNTYRGENKKAQLNNTLGETILAIDLMGSMPQNEQKQSRENNRAKRLNDFIKKQTNTLSFKEEMKKKKSLNLKNPSQANNIPLKMNDNETNYAKTTNLKDVKSPELKNMVITSQKNQVLLNSVSKFWLPHQVQQEKDIIIVHYQPSVKQIIHGDMILIMHRHPTNLFKMNTAKFAFQSLSKVHRYILQNKIKIEDTEMNEEQEDIFLQKMICNLPHSLFTFKEGIILKYGKSESIIVSKLFIQEPFHIWDMTRTGTSGFAMYTVDSQGKEQASEGIVVMRIYTGWVKNMLGKK